MTSRPVLLKLSVVKGYFSPNLLKTDTFVGYNINVTAMTNGCKSFQVIIMSAIFSAATIYQHCIQLSYTGSP